MRIIKQLSSDRKPFFSTINIILTDKCNISCRHCMFDCTSTSLNELECEKIEEIIRDYKKIRDSGRISFTGGEPFLRFDCLKKCVELCSQLHLSSAVITNGFWASNIEEARDYLRQISSLDMLTVSTDKFHQEFIPINNISNVINACDEFGIKCVVRVSYLSDPGAEMEIIRSQLLALDNKYDLSEQPIQSIGRAEKCIDFQKGYYSESQHSYCEAPDSPFILTNGDLVACCGRAIVWKRPNPLILGNIYESRLEVIWEKAENNILIHLLRLRGPGELIRQIEEIALKEKIGTRTRIEASGCDMCSLCKTVMCKEENEEFLKLISESRENYHAIALIRLIELGEISMIEKYIDGSETNKLDTNNRGV